MILQKKFKVTVILFEKAQAHDFCPKGNNGGYMNHHRVTGNPSVVSAHSTTAWPSLASKAHWDNPESRIWKCPA